MFEQQTKRAAEKFTIVDVSGTSEGLAVKFSDASEDILFSWFWLKDHGVDEISLDAETLQRRVDTFAIPTDLSSTDVQFDHELQTVLIAWCDGTATTISKDLLMQVTGRLPRAEELTPDQPLVLWNQHQLLTELPCVDYQSVMCSDDGVYDWLTNIAIYGFSLVQDVPSTKQATEALARRIGLIEENIFGTVWMLSAELTEHDDSAYSTAYLEPHTDATYYHDAAGLQMFNCLEFDGKGGESILVDSFAIAEQIRREAPDAFHMLTQVSVPGRYLEPGRHLHAERTPFRLNNYNELVQVSFNNYDRAPFILPGDEMRRFYQAYSLLHKHAVNQKNWLKVALRPGMALIFDNWRTMHGRMGYVGKRVFCGCYHNRSEFESKLRVLQSQRSEKINAASNQPI